jgi:hypothetical protein
MGKSSVRALFFLLMASLLYWRTGIWARWFGFELNDITTQTLRLVPAVLMGIVFAFFPFSATRGLLLPLTSILVVIFILAASVYGIFALLMVFVDLFFASVFTLGLLALPAVILFGMSWVASRFIPWMTVYLFPIPAVLYIAFIMATTRGAWNRFRDHVTWFTDSVISVSQSLRKIAARPIRALWRDIPSAIGDPLGSDIYDLSGRSKFPSLVAFCVGVMSATLTIAGFVPSANWINPASILGPAFYRIASSTPQPRPAIAESTATVTSKVITQSIPKTATPQVQPTAPSNIRTLASFRSLKANHNQVQEDVTGLQIVGTIYLKNTSGNLLKATAYFTDQNKKHLSDKNGRFRSKSGLVAISLEYRASRQSSEEWEVKLFMPYSELDYSQNTGKRDLYFYVEVEDLNASVSLAKSEFVYFYFYP